MSAPHDGARGDVRKARAGESEPAAAFLNRAFTRQRSRLVVELDLDPVPGWGNVAEDHRALVQRLLADSVGHYNPTVVIEDAPVNTKATALRDTADELWRVFLRLQRTPSPVGDYVHGRVLAFREAAARAESEAGR